jgi:hypothetical protein
LCGNKNPDALEIIKKYISAIKPYGCVNDRSELSRSEYAWVLLEENRNLIYYSDLCENPHALPLIEKVLQSKRPICWRYFCENPRCMEIINKQEKLFGELLEFESWEILCKRSDTMDFIEKYTEKLSKEAWNILVKNESAVHILEKNLHKLNYSCVRDLCYNRSALKIITENLHSINTCGWEVLSRMPWAIHIIKENMSKVCYKNLCANEMALEILCE